MKQFARVAACLSAGLLLLGCGEDEADFGTDTTDAGTGKNAPRVLVDGDGRKARRQELERPIEDQARRVSCPSQVALGEGAKFNCKFSDPELGTGVVLVEQVDANGRLEYSTLPRSSTSFEGSFDVAP